VLLRSLFPLTPIDIYLPSSLILDSSLREGTPPSSSPGAPLCSVRSTALPYFFFTVFSPLIKTRIVPSGTQSLAIDPSLPRQFLTGFSIRRGAPLQNASPLE